MDLFLIVLGAILVLVGIVGSVLPVLPGLPVSWAGLLFIKFTDEAAGKLSWQCVIWTGVAMLVVTVIDQILPIWGTKKMGGSKLVVMGASAGLVFGLFFGVLGIILGPFVGAFLGSLIEGNHFTKAARQAMGAFIGFFAGIVLKLICGGLIAWFFITALI